MMMMLIIDRGTANDLECVAISDLELLLISEKKTNVLLRLIFFLYGKLPFF
jgi:hypothetical protein